MNEHWWKEDPSEWSAQQREDVAEVIMQTARDDLGVSYGVSIALCSLAAHAYEEGEDRVQIWTTRIEFGQTDSHCHGGSAFVRAARRQQTIVDQIAAYVWAKEPRHG